MQREARALPTHYSRLLREFGPGAFFIESRPRASGAVIVARRPTILRQLEKLKAGEFVFSGQARGKPLSNMAMEMVLRRMKVEDATVHGFRSSFRGLGWQRLQLPPRVSYTAAATPS